jgi:hypothetical protein
MARKCGSCGRVTRSNHADVTPVAAHRNARTPLCRTGALGDTEQLSLDCGRSGPIVAAVTAVGQFMQGPQRDTRQVSLLTFDSATAGLLPLGASRPIKRRRSNRAEEHEWLRLPFRSGPSARPIEMEAVRNVVHR